MRRQQAGGPAEQTSAAKPAAEAETPLPPSELETQLPQAVRETFLKPFTGDLDEMVKRRVVRIGVTFNRTFYFVDKGVQRGVAYDYGQLVEERLNTHFKTDNANKSARDLRAAAARPAARRSSTARSIWWRRRSR